MKITIEMNEKEIATFINIFSQASGEKLSEQNKDQHVVGSFGEFKYDIAKRTITVDLKTAFIVATSHMILSVVNMIKSFISTMEMFSESWFSDSRDLIKEKEEKEKLENENNLNPSPEPVE